MTIAVCIRCGKMKHGAITACLACRFTPKEPEELAKSIMLSDHVCDSAALDKASETLKRGGIVEFDPQALAQWTAGIAANPDWLRIPLGCAILLYAPVVIMVVLVLLF